MERLKIYIRVPTVYPGVFPGTQPQNPDLCTLKGYLTRERVQVQSQRVYRSKIRKSACIYSGRRRKGQAVLSLGAARALKGDEERQRTKKDSRGDMKGLICLFVTLLVAGKYKRRGCRINKRIDEC